MECSWSVASSGPDESSQVVLVTGDLDVYRIDNMIKRGCLRFWRVCFRQQCIWCDCSQSSLSNELKDAFNDGCISDKSVLDRVVCLGVS